MVLKLRPLEELPAGHPDRGLVLGFLAFWLPDNDGKLEEDDEDEEDELDRGGVPKQRPILLVFLALLLHVLLGLLLPLLLVCLSLLLQRSLSCRIAFEKDFPHPLAAGTGWFPEWALGCSKCGIPWYGVLAWYTLPRRNGPNGSVRITILAIAIW